MTVQQTELIKCNIMLPTSVFEVTVEIFSVLTLPDLSLLLPTMLSRGGGPPPQLPHEPFALRTSYLVGC